MGTAITAIRSTGRLPAVRFDVDSQPVRAGYGTSTRMSCFMQRPAGPEVGYSLADLCALADLPVHVVRQYIQMRFVDCPTGDARSARYGPHHLAQLRQIRKWTDAGTSLVRIRKLVQDQGESARLVQRSTRGVW